MCETKQTQTLQNHYSLLTISQTRCCASLQWKPYTFDIKKIDATVPADRTLLVPLNVPGRFSARVEQRL